MAAAVFLACVFGLFIGLPWLAGRAWRRWRGPRSIEELDAEIHRLETETAMTNVILRTDWIKQAGKLPGRPD